MILRTEDGREELGTGYRVQFQPSINIREIQPHSNPSIARIYNATKLNFRDNIRYSGMFENSDMYFVVHKNFEQSRVQFIAPKESRSALPIRQRKTVLTRQNKRIQHNNLEEDKITTKKGEPT